MTGPDKRPNQLLVLGIESSCDETAAAVVRRSVRTEAGDGKDCKVRGEILSNVVRTQIEAHRDYGGVVPEIAARAHAEVVDEVIRIVIAEAGLGFGDLDGISATAGPGLVGGLMVGLVTGKAIALAAGKPLIAVNHLEGHALTVGLTDGQRPPYLLLLVSGGHCQLLDVEDVGSYRRLGTTIDDAVGEAFDKTAKLLGLGFPGGPALEAAAQAGDPNRFILPHPMKGRPEPHFSFAGLKTAVRQQAEAVAPLSDQDVADICASFQKTVGEILSERTAVAMEIFSRTSDPSSGTAPTLVIAGGVAANQSIAAALRETAAVRGFRVKIPPPALCTDNGAMIAWAGAEHLARDEISTLDVAVRPRWPLDPDALHAPGQSPQTVLR